MRARHFAPMLALAVIGLLPSLLLAAPTQDCSGFGKPETQSELLRGRLAITVPAGAETLANRPRSLMGPSDADESRSEVKVAHDGMHLRVIAVELFARRGALTEPELVAAIAKFIAMQPDEVTPLDLGSTSLRLVAVEPRTPRAIDEATTRFASVVEDADGYLVFVGISLDGEATSGAACVALVRDIARTLSPGSRKLATSGGWRRVGAIAGIGEVEINLPDGWVVRKSAGPDFDVWQMFAPSALGESTNAIGLYAGGHPSFQGKGATATNGRILGKRAGWYVQAEDGQTVSSTLVKLSSHDFLHAWTVALASADVPKLRAIVETLRVARGN